MCIRDSITAGYQLRLNKALTLDFNLGLGYLNADFEKYEVIDGVRVRLSLIHIWYGKRLLTGTGTGGAANRDFRLLLDNGNCTNSYGNSHQP